MSRFARQRKGHGVPERYSRDITKDDLWMKADLFGKHA
jgi:hypothetical protein